MTELTNMTQSFASVARKRREQVFPCGDKCTNKP